MGALNFCVAGLMASKGHAVSEVAGNKNIRWQVKGSYATGIIACSYIFVGFYGLTWVCGTVLTLTPILIILPL